MYNKFKTITAILAKTQNTILSAAFILAIATGINAVLGMLKGRLLAQYFGVSNDLAVFLTADKIPTLIYSILIVGAISTVFIPVFSELMTKDKEKAFHTASSIINFTLIAFFVMGAGISLFAMPIIRLISLGKFTQQEIALGASLMNILLAGQLILIASSLITSILQSFKYFLIPALAPTLHSLGMIFGIIFLTENYGIYAPAIGTIIGSCLHLLIQIPLLTKTGYKYKLAFNLSDKGLCEVLYLVPPRLISVLVANSIAIMGHSLSLTISAASAIYLRFAIQLQTFPVTLFGLSMSSASLPTLSAYSDKKNLDKFKKTFLTSFHQTMFLVLPLSIILLVLRVPAVRIIYGVRNFPWDATLETASTLGLFSISIFAQSANYLITRAFYALKDTKTPVLVSVVTGALNVGLSILFIKFTSLGVGGIALAFSTTAIIDMLALLYFLNIKVGGFEFDQLITPLTKIVYAALLMGFTLYIPLKLLDQYIFDTTRTINLIAATGIAGLCGGLTYLVFTKLLKVEEIELLYKLLRRLNLQKKDVTLEQNNTQY